MKKKGMRAVFPFSISYCWWFVNSFDCNRLYKLCDRFNKNFEYFQALNLGANNFLRGFRKNRFSGSSLAYGSLELRLRLFRSKWYVLPGDFGIVGFNDVGRVWLNGDESKRWHYTYGGGIYYVPFNMVIVSGTMGFSKEENLFNFSIGTKINLTF